MRIEGSVMLVTGASSGIGEATARAASQAGAKLLLVARRVDRLHSLAEELGEAMAIGCDITDAAQAAEAVRAGIVRFGRIDILVNNAGQGLQASIETTELDDLRAILELNVVGPVIMMQAVLPQMRRQGGGSIINVSSGTTLRPYPEAGGYSGSKAALNMLSGVAREELKDTGIVVSTILPFITSTEFIGSVKAGREAAKELETATAGIAHKPDFVAEKILKLVLSGEAQVDLVPEAFGGSLQV